MGFVLVVVMTWARGAGIGRRRADGRGWALRVARSELGRR